MATDQELIRSGLQKYLAQNRGMPPVIDGPRLEHFQAEETSRAIMSELRRAQIMGYTKINLTLDLKDAHDLAQFLANAR